ncbi:DUF2752 domain-containing protein [Nocardioides sp. CBS4Y-1]|uniref:DUF2752 domain-containing protein n=2 Tax=Nocardioides acrostichi TaxID=2784339 RepID=A0A930Y672_9ACTN|nr:DUF2752 domain-containing protein [Nocardioides acrostichi]
MTTAAAAAAAVVIASVDPHEPGHYPTCPFLAVTGEWCPGCGSLRAINSLLHGHVAGAFERNPLVPLALPFLGFTYVMWVLRLTGKTSWSPTLIPARAVWVLLGTVLAFWVLRNVPGWTFLSPD